MTSLRPLVRGAKPYWKPFFDGSARALPVFS
jgi:hypothetical protein